MPGQPVGCAVADPQPPKLPHPSSSPRLHKSGRQNRGRPIYRQSAGVDLQRWEIEVTPLEDTTFRGRSLTGGRLKPRATFEVRAAFYGAGAPEFGSQPNTRLIRETHTEDEELALAIARTAEAVLRSGNRELDLVALAKDVEERRAG